MLAWSQKLDYLSMLEGEHELKKKKKKRFRKHLAK